MRDHRPTLAPDVLSRTRLAEIQERAGALIELNRQLQKILPNQAAKYCRAGNWQSGLLIVEVASASWAMKLNYQKLDLLNHFRRNGYAGMSSIEFKVNPSLYVSDSITQEEAPKRTPISDQAAMYLESVAQSAPPKIKARLERIAKLSK